MRLSLTNVSVIARRVYAEAIYIPLTLPSPHGGEGKRLRSMSRHGFTLIELIVVLAIIAVATAIVAPSITSGMASVNLKSSANHLAATMRYARTCAISHKAICAVNLYLNEGRYSVSGSGQQTDERLHAGVRFEEINYGNETVRQGIGQFFFTQRAIPLPGKSY